MELMSAAWVRPYIAVRRAVRVVPLLSLPLLACQLRADARHSGRGHDLFGWWWSMQAREMHAASLLVASILDALKDVPRRRSWACFTAHSQDYDVVLFHLHQTSPPPPSHVVSISLLRYSSFECTTRTATSPSHGDYAQDTLTAQPNV